MVAYKVEEKFPGHAKDGEVFGRETRLQAHVLGSDKTRGHEGSNGDGYAKQTDGEYRRPNIEQQKTDHGNNELYTVVWQRNLGRCAEGEKQAQGIRSGTAGHSGLPQPTALSQKQQPS